MVQGQLGDGLSVAKDLSLLTLVVQSLNVGSLQARLGKHGQDESLRRGIESTNASWIIDGLQRSEEVKVGQVVHVQRVAHHDDDLVFPQLYGDHRLANLDLFNFLQFVLVPDRDFVRLLPRDDRHDLSVEEELGDLNVSEATSFELTLEGIRHEHTEPISRPDRDAAIILIEAKGPTRVTTLGLTTVCFWRALTLLLATRFEWIMRENLRL